MLRQVSTTSLPLIVYNPTGVFSADYFSHCARAGALPVFDTEMISDDDAIRYIDGLAKSEFLFGVRVSAAREKIFKHLNDGVFRNCDAVVIYYDRIDELKSFSAAGSPYTIIVEVTDISINDILERIDPNALILKGFEAPGKVSKFTSFVMLQWYAEKSSFPFFVHGGVGYYTAAGMFAAGASGIVLDDQLFLTDEAPVSENIRNVLSKLEESDTLPIIDDSGVRRRFFAKLGTKIVRELSKKEDSGFYKQNSSSLYEDIKSNFAPVDRNRGDAMQNLFYLGQDAIFAKYFTLESKNVTEIIQSLFKRISEELALVEKHDPMVEGSILAKDHGTRYPITQGPMANISDNMGFAQAVYNGGALPFFAVGSLPADIAKDMLIEGKKVLPSYGAGMVGVLAFNKFLPQHMDLVKTHKAPFALFAAGNPSQIKELEAAGTKAYLHTPSMAMLTNAISSGCRRFIFEGTEAGGHIGNLSSMVLWELALETANSLPAETIGELRLLFAGGIGTPRASHFVSGMASSTAARGCGVGVQVSTPYLFSKEIVETGALTELYQQIMCRENETIVIGNTVGLNARTVGSPFSRRIHENEIHRLVENIPLSERKELFEHDNTGSLLIGAKGVRLDFSDPKNVKKVPVDSDGQYKEGNFMAGDILACDDSQITISEIHNRIIHSKEELAKSLNCLEILFSENGMIRDEIAIVGVGCVYPDALSPEQLWQNVMSKRYSITEMPEERLRPFYYDRDKKAEDKTYTKLAATVSDYRFDYKKFGFTESEGKGISRSQAMVLEAAARAVEDAGYEGKLPAERTAVIIASCLTNEMNSDLNFKYLYPEILYYLDQIDEFKSLSDSEKQKLRDSLKAGMSHGHINEVPEGASIHMESSRVASYLGVEGVNYTIDAACASSIAALDAGRKELLAGLHDVIVVGGLNTNLSPESFVGFCKMGALSADGSFPFDERANGFVLGEGAGVVVIKRMKDALRDGDRIYAVIKGIGSSSDGKGKAIAAPNPDGQELALDRCYNSMFDRVSLSDIDYIEAHGTSTLMGDLAEIETLKKVYGGPSTHIGLSSVKSQIGHLLGGAGLAGLIKAIMAIKHKTLPPNGQFEKLSPRFDLSGSGMYIIKDPVQWETKNGKPRLAAISSFGFGGVNFHCVIGEADASYTPVSRSDLFSLTRDINDRRVVIAGLGVVLPGIKNVDEYLNAIESGKSLLTELPGSRFHNEYFTNENDAEYSLPKITAGVLDDSVIDGKKYRMPPTIVKSLDRSQFIALDCTRQALEQAGIAANIEKGNNTAIIVGTMNGEKMLDNIIRTRIPLLSSIIRSTQGDSAKLTAIDEKLSAALKQKYHVNNEDTVPGLLSNIVSGRIANFFGLNGVNFTIDSGSASSAVAMRLAMLGVRFGEYESAVTGGIDSSLTPSTFRSLKIAGMLSNGNGSVFDKNSDGVNLSEGGALFVVTSYRNAKEKNMPIVAQIENIGMRGRSRRDETLASETSFFGAAATAYATSCITKRQVNYVELFGSALQQVDLSEHGSLNRIYKAGVLAGNTTPETGYYRSANPAIAILKLALMNSRGKITPSAKLGTGSSIITGDSLLKPVKSAIALKENTPRYFAADIFSTGGVYGHALIGSLPMSVSAVKRVQPAITVATVQPPASIIPSKGNYTSVDGSMVTALLTGQGAQHAGMMKELYQANGIIRDTLDRGNAIFKTVRGYSLLDMMFGDSDAINSTENTQPAIFLSTAAIYDALKQDGFNPAYFIGHSLGECSALYCAGILSFEDAMKLILTRSSLMKEAAVKTAGEMIVVFGSSSDADALIKKSGIKDVYVTNKNSDSQTVVAGTKDGIASYSAELKTANIVFKKLPLSGAFHTPLFASAAFGLSKYLAGVKFNNVDFTRVISNVTAKPYPQDEAQVKELLAKQVVSPVEFIESVKFAIGSGAASFIEAGPAGVLTNLLKSIKPAAKFSAATVDQKKGQTATFEEARRLLGAATSINRETQMSNNKTNQPAAVYKTRPADLPALDITGSAGADEGFRNFLSERKEEVERVLYDEYRKFTMMKEIKEREKFGFYTGDVLITGAAVGLPGKSRKVFEDDNFDCILKGENRIETIADEYKKHQINKNITRVNKKSDGSATFQVIKNDNEVVQLAGQLGYFNRLDYGIEFDNDKADALAMAAGIEALRDAGIPLVPQMKKTSTGSYLFDGYGLPEEMQNTTGVIRTSVFAGFDSIIEEVAKYTTYLNVNGPLRLFESIYYFIMEKTSDEEVKKQVTDWYFNLKKQGADGEYVFNRNFILKMGYMGAPQFAQFIKAKGPNTQSNAACASVTQGIAIAEDWIRTGRCDRVVVIGSEVTDSERLGQWLHAGFLAMGAATIKNNVFEAAKPFDAERNGTIIGSGAAAIVVERGDMVRKRGRAGQAEILGTFFGNSAFHGTRIDVNHIGEIFRNMVDRAERRFGLDKDEYTKSMMFMSHETFTPAVGGSAQAEIDAIKGTYPQHYRNITISNTKGFTGHTLGGGLEDPVMIKAMQHGITPPIANLSKVPAEFSDLRFSRGEKGSFNYGLHFAAGFGSHFALLFARRIEERPMDNADYLAWLKNISGYEKPELSLINKALCIKVQEGVVRQAPAAVSRPAAPAAIPAQVTAAAAPIAKTATPAQPVSAPVITAPAQKAAPSGGQDMSAIKSKIKSVVASQTGYTVDMLEDGLDLEADLGIDTVKQVEIFGKISAEFSLDVPEDLKLSDMNTIEKLVQYIASKVKVSAPAAVSAASAVIPAAASAQPASAGVDMSTITKEIKSVIAAQTGYTVDMLEDGLDLEADLGIDTVKQVEIFGKVSAQFSLDVPEDLKLSDMNTIEKLVQYIASKVKVAAPAAQASVPAVASAQPASAGVDLSHVKSEIKSVIAAQTGYTVDMLEDGLDLEADLGIDTVKQVEIFGKVSAQFSLEVPEDLKLSDMNTIEKLVQYIASKVQIAAPAAFTSAAPVHAVSHTAAVSSGVDLSQIKAGIKEVISAQTGYTVDMLEDGLDLEADLGIDTVKQVEIFGKVSAQFSLDVPEDLKLSDMNTIEKLVQYIASKVQVAAPAAFTSAAPVHAVSHTSVSSGVDLSQIKAGIKEVISAQTGYTVDMLEDGLDLEADLGIDTVKQVEIFGKVSAQFSLDVPEDLKLSDMNTIEKLVQYIASKVQIAAPAAFTSAAPVHAVSHTAAVSSGVDLSQIKAGIKEVISAQTGYTVDMLEDGLDLEADLGIDTVKQVEIFGKVSAQFSLDVPEDLKLSDMNTIEKLVQYIASKVNATASVSTAVTAPAAAVSEVKSDAIHRFTISVTPLPAVKKGSSDFTGKTFLISRDSNGFTEKISERIVKNGGKVLTIGGSGQVDCKVDMTDPVDVEKAVIAFADVHDGINSFIHLAPIDYALSGTHTTPKAIESSVKAFFTITKALHQKLRKKGSIIAAPSFNSVVFPYGETAGEIYPVFAGVSGMLKTVNKEFTDAVVKAVDFATDSPKKSADAISELFVNELLSGDKRVEVGYRGNDRFGLVLNDEAPANGESLVKDGSTLLVTGGAGGITFEILKRFVNDFRNLKLIIFDITDIDSIKQEFLAESANEEFIISALKGSMQGAKPLEIKNAASKVMRAKKAYSNMNELKKLGADVDYHTVDVNSADSVAKAVKKYKKIDGIIHAAGMEESQILEKMTLDSFNRVFNVKAYGSLNLVSALSKIDYTFFVAFSSVSGRFGNEGQVNYSGGNEMLAKILLRERASHRNRVYKICDWTAWEGAGMATNETVNKVLKERGMTFLPLKQGIDIFVNELRDSAAVEAIFTGVDAAFDRDGTFPGNGVSGAEIAPFLDSVVKSGPDRISFARTLDLNRDLFISDHTKDGIPLFLGATGIETMAEAAAQLAGKGAVLRELRDFQIPYSIKILKGRPKEIFVEAEKDRGAAGTVKCRITSQFKNTRGVVVGDPTLHYEGSYIFSGETKQPVIAIPPKKRVEVDGDFQQIIYHPERLFMDGVFRTVQGIHSFDGELLVTTMKHAPERDFFSGVAYPDFLVDVVLIDAMFQTGGIFEMMTTSDIILPSKINRMLFHQAPERDREYLCFTRKLASGVEANTFSLILADYDGKVYIEIDSFDMVKVTRVPLESRIDKRFRVAG